MSEPRRCDIALAGCTPEPLMAYLKALGILRLVSKQKDCEARGWWRNDVFWLRSMLEEDELVRFFVEKYRPTPIVVPWSGNDFFDVDWGMQQRTFSETPTAGQAIEAFLATTAERFATYRKVLHACNATLGQCGIVSKETLAKKKWLLIEALRSSCDDPGVVEWIDAAAVITAERFAALLGSGGGSDGNTHLSDNFMQNLWDVLPEFDDQRPNKEGRPQSVVNASREQLQNALFARRTTQLIRKRTSSLYDSGAVGGPNATQGMERESQSNPWNVVFALEGVVCFAGAVVKRQGAGPFREGAFPFQVSASASSHDTLKGKEPKGAELWLPLWSRQMTFDELLGLLREGRMQCGARPVKCGVDVARAIATLGVDRGVASFQRYAIVKGRVGGDNYNSATPLERVEVREQRGADLLVGIDGWLDRFRLACSAKDAPARFEGTLRAIDSAVFDFCKYGGNSFFQRILVAFGRAERELGTAERFRDKQHIRPLTGLSYDWLDAANDGSLEFALALGLASIYDPEQKIEPIRANLESVDWQKRCRAWAQRDRAVVWNARDVPRNLTNVLERRMMDGERTGCERLPLASRFTVPLDTVAAFIDGALDDGRVEDLIWGLMLADPRWRNGRERIELNRPVSPPLLPRDYALLKLLFLPRPLVPERAGDQVRWRFAREGEAGVTICAEPRIPRLLRGGRIGDACRIAAERLRASGLPSMPRPLPTGLTRDREWAQRTTDARRGQRVAAALLVPVSSSSVNRLVGLVCRDKAAAAETFAMSTEGEAIR